MMATFAAPGGLHVPRISPGSENDDARDVADRIGENWSQSPVPNALPGSPEVPRVTIADVVMAPIPPTICRLGPCRNYHEARVLLPAHGVDGKSILVRTCYPHPGIEMDLQDTPVLECNRYWPEIGVGRPLERDKARDLIMNSEAGAEYKTALDAWREEVRAIYAAADPAPTETPADTQEGTNE